MLGSVKLDAPLELDFVTDRHMLLQARHGCVTFFAMLTLVFRSLFFWPGGRGFRVLFLSEGGQRILQLFACLVLPSNVLRMFSGNPIEFTQKVVSLPCQGNKRILRVQNCLDLFIRDMREMGRSPGYSTGLPGSHCLEGSFACVCGSCGKQSVSS